MISIPKPSAFVFITETVCGKTRFETKNLFAPDFFWSLVLLSKNMCIASAAAVASSNKEAFANLKPDKSQTTVWKLRSASNLP